MTTNVYDVDQGLFTSDARWSVEAGDRIFFVDDTGYSKIVYDKQWIALFAGNLLTIDLWKQWFKAGMPDDGPGVYLELSLCIADIHTGEAGFDSEDCLHFPARPAPWRARFSGTGMAHAMNCWLRHRCARRAVHTASGLDACTGGQIGYFDRFSRLTNIRDDATLDEVAWQLDERGMTMKTTDRQAVPIKDAVAADPAVREAYNTVKLGGSSLCAPYAGMTPDWTPEKKAELATFLKNRKK